MRPPRLRLITEEGRRREAREENSVCCVRPKTALSCYLCWVMRGRRRKGGGEIVWSWWGRGGVKRRWEKRKSEERKRVKGED